MSKTNQNTQKQAYASPEVQVVRLQMENGLCTASMEGFDDGGSYNWTSPAPASAFENFENVL